LSRRSQRLDSPIPLGQARERRSISLERFIGSFELPAPPGQAGRKRTEKGVKQKKGVRTEKGGTEKLTAHHWGHSFGGQGTIQWESLS